MTDKEVKYTPLQERAIGCLFGQATGDALGTRYEFGSAEKTLIQVAKDMKIALPMHCPKLPYKFNRMKGKQAAFPKATLPFKTTDEWVKYLCGNGHLPILGDGPFSLSPGQVTDDTEMALAVADGLTQASDFDVWAIADNYSLWHKSGPFDQGGTTRAALCKTDINYEKGVNYDIMIHSSSKLNKESLSNGCLMRISPLAIAGTHWTEDSLALASKMDCEMTNPNPITQDAVAVYVAAIRTAILTGDAKATHEVAKKRANTKEVLNLLIAAETTSQVKLSTGRIAEVDGSTMGYFGIALQLAFYHLLKGLTYEHALIDVIIRGGDTDTNAAIVGALLGAVQGFKAIPKDWMQSVTEAETQWRYEEYPLLDTHNLDGLALKLLETNEPTFTDELLEEIAELDSDSDTDVNVNVNVDKPSIPLGDIPIIDEKVESEVE